MGTALNNERQAVVDNRSGNATQDIIAFRDYVVNDVLVKDVPFIFKKHATHESYLLKGDTLGRVHRLVDDNAIREHPKQVIKYTQS